MKDYKICNNCIMDISDPDISFNSDGICNHCVDSIPKLKKLIFTEEQIKKNLDEIKLKIKSKRKGVYDCIIGMSGGVDSSYLCLLAKKTDFNALVAHVDNGWNSIESVKNIKTILNKIEFDY